MTLNCLVTGFDAFADEPFNPSQAIVGGLPEALEFSGSLVPIQKLILPTCGDEAWTKLEPLLGEMMRNGLPTVVVLLGLASKRNTICLERFALNIKDDQTLDNKGHSFVDEVIDPMAPTALRTKAPLLDVLKHLHDGGWPAVTSNHAGTFVCNEIYFRTLQYFSKLRDASIVSFVHLPLPENYAKTLSEMQSEVVMDDRAAQVAAMQAVIRSIIGYYLNHPLAVVK